MYRNGIIVTSTSYIVSSYIDYFPSSNLKFISLTVWLFQIVFIGINCWIPDGDCYKKNKFGRYPQFYTYVQSTDNPVVYTDEPTATKMVSLKFLNILKIFYVLIIVKYCIIASL